MSGLFARYREISRPARAFLGGGLLIEISHTFIWVLQNLYARSIGYGEEDVGGLLSAAALGVVVFTFPAARLYQRLGARSSLTLSCAGAALSLAGLAFSESYPALLTFCFLNGCCFTLHIVVSAPYIVSISTPRERTHLFQAEFATHAVAMTVGALLAGRIAGSLEGLFDETTGLRATLLLGAVLGLAGALIYMRLPADRPASRDVGPSPLSILRPAHWHLWVRVSVPHVLVGIGAGLTIPFINLYFTDRFGLPKADLGDIMAVSSITMLVGALLTPWAVARLGLVRTTIATEALSIPFFLMMAFTLSFPVAVMAFVLRSALMNLSQPTWRNLIMEITPDEWRAAVNSISMLSWNLGWALSNRTGGWLIENSAGTLGTESDGYVLPMLITIGTYLLAILAEALFFWRYRHVGMQPASRR